MKLVFAATTIFDDENLLPASGFSINGVAQTQIDNNLRATHASFQFRGNSYNDIRFSVTQKHASQKDAEAHLLTHALAVTGKGTAEFTIGVTGDTDTRSAAGSVLTCSGTRRGVSTTFSYNLKAPAFA